MNSIMLKTLGLRKRQNGQTSLYASDRTASRTGVRLPPPPPFLSLATPQTLVHEPASIAPGDTSRSKGIGRGLYLRTLGSRAG